MNTETELKEKLELLAQQDFQLDDKSELWGIVQEMLNHIGSLDSSLRDDLIYTAFATWILESKVFSEKQLKELAQIVLGDQYIFYQIGEANTDSVFRRSFSVLILPLLLSAHREEPFLAQDEIIQIKDKLILYLDSEHDRRGFVEDKGWAHAIAHAADALDDLVQCNELGKSDLLDVLEAIYGVVTVSETGYVCGEDERIVTAVTAIIDRCVLSDTEVKIWLQSFADAVLACETIPEKVILRTNVKNFLRSLYFRLQWQEIGDRFNTTIDQTLQKVSIYANHGT